MTKKTMKFEEFVGNDRISYTNGLMPDVTTFGEFRKGSEKYGGLINKLMDWLRLQKENTNQDADNVIVSFDKFENETSIKISEIEDFIKDKIADGLYNFEVVLDYDNNLIKFDSLKDNPDAH